MNILGKFIDAVKVNDDFDDEDFLDDLDDDFDDEKPKKRFFKKLDDDFDDDFDDIPSSKSYKKAEKQTAATKQPKPAKQAASASSKVTPMYNVKKPTSSSEVCVIKPKQFDDATEIVDALLDNCSSDVCSSDLIIDFTSGASYSIQGSIRKVSSYIFILTPEGVDITGDSQDLLNDITGASMYEGI